MTLLEKSTQRVAIDSIQNVGEDLFYGSENVINEALLIKMGHALNLSEEQVANLSKLNLSAERLSDLAMANLEDLTDLLNNSLNYYGEDYTEPYTNILSDMGGEGILVYSNVEGKRVPIGYALMHKIDLDQDVLDKDEYADATFKKANFPGTLEDLNNRIGSQLTTSNVLHFWDYAVSKELRSQGLGKVAMFLASNAIISPDGARLGYISESKPDSMIASMKGGSILCNYRESPYPDVDDGNVITSIFGPSFELEFTGNVLATHREVKEAPEAFVEKVCSITQGGKFVAYNSADDRYEEVLITANPRA